MNSPRFSVVIPTRNRARTLAYTLQTCLAQQFEDYEIIVCDNFGTPETRQVVDNCASSKIRYIRSDRPLAMSENWELAVSEARGEYVIVVGDDDGLLRHALPEINQLLDLLNTKVLRWERVYYSWPDIAVSWAADRLEIPFSRDSEMINARSAIAGVASLQADYSKLPMLYNSAIHRDLITELKRRTGRVFSARCPDVYTGFAFAYLVGQYPSVGRPMTINGGSAASNGVATVVLRGNSPIAEEFNRLCAAAQLILAPTVPDISTISSALADSFLQAKSRLFPDDRNLQLDRRRLTLNTMAETNWIKADSATRSQIEGLILKSLADDKSLTAWFQQRVLPSQSKLKPVETQHTWEKGVRGSTHNLIAREFDVHDVDGVSALCAKLMGPPEGGIASLFDDTGWRKRALFRRLKRVARILIKGN